MNNASPEIAIGAALCSVGVKMMMFPKWDGQLMIIVIIPQEEDKKEEELDENLFYCPKCNKSFTQYRPLEEHVNRCLDED